MTSDSEPPSDSEREPPAEAIAHALYLARIQKIEVTLRKELAERLLRKSLLELRERRDKLLATERELQETEHINFDSCNPEAQSPTCSQST